MKHDNHNSLHWSFFLRWATSISLLRKRYLSVVVTRAISSWQILPVRNSWRLMSTKLMERATSLAIRMCGTPWTNLSMSSTRDSLIRLKRYTTPSCLPLEVRRFVSVWVRRLSQRISVLLILNTQKITYFM